MNTDLIADEALLERARALAAGLTGETALPRPGELRRRARELRALSAELGEGWWPTRFGADIAWCAAWALDGLAHAKEEGEDTGEQCRLLLHPLLWHLENDLALWLGTWLRPGAMSVYRHSQVEALRRLRAQWLARRRESQEVEVSIGVTAYNKLAYTKLAVESILRHTDLTAARAELILIDNGSTDGTARYFRQVPGARCILLPRPLGYPATSLGAHAARGRYYVHFANDIVATPGWLETLLACVGSGDDVGMVVPVCNSMSSGQSIQVAYPDPMDDSAGLDDFARSYNRHDPQRWEERVRLLPCMSIMPRPVALAAANDSLYHFGEFADDDVSTRLRRAGWRQILAADTFVHHYGSVTAGDAQRRQQSLQRSRELFRAKWEVDPWTSLNWHIGLGERVARELPETPGPVLWINPQFCALPVQVGDLRRRLGLPRPAGWGLVEDPAFLPDARALLQHAVCGDLGGCLSHLSHKAPPFQAVVFCQQLPGGGEDPTGLLRQLAALLAPGGRIYAHIRNRDLLAPLEDAARELFLPSYIDYTPWSVHSPGVVGRAAEAAGLSAELVPAGSVASAGALEALRALTGTGQGHADPPREYLCVFTRADP